MGTAFLFGPYGVASIAGAGSYSDGRSGGLINAAIELGYQDWDIYGRIQRTFGNYEDIASVTFAPKRDKSLISHADPGVPQTIAQVNVSMPTPLDFSSLNASYTHIENTNGERSDILGLSYNHQFSKNLSGYASVNADIGGNGGFGVFASLSMTFDNDIRGSTWINSDDNGTHVVAEVTKSQEQVDGTFGWRLRTSEGEYTHRSVNASYRSPWAKFEAGVEQHESDFTATGQVSGSIVATLAGVFIGNRINDSFAVVDAGAPDVEVSVQNRPVGKTGRNGKKLVTGLVSYEENLVSINPTSLPVEASIAATRRIAVPAEQRGVVLDFGIQVKTAAALVTFVDPAGKPLDVGLTGQIDGIGDTFFVGYDGQAYIEGL